MKQLQCFVANRKRHIATVSICNCLSTVQLKIISNDAMKHNKRISFKLITTIGKLLVRQKILRYEYLILLYSRDSN